jgi:hypothetical protein
VLKPFQFNIRHLLLATVVTAVAITFLQAIPALFMLAFFAAVALGITGVTGICIALAIGLTIYISEDDGNRRFNLARCRDWIGVGLIANLPLAICFILIPYL